MKNSKLNLYCAVFFLLITSITFAQNKWSAEFRPNINFPTEDLGNSNIKTGFGFEATIGYRFLEHLHAYAGWGYNTFAIEDAEADFDETGYTFGLQFIHPLGNSEDLSYLLRAGAIYNHLELEDGNGDLIDDSNHGFGWQLEAGLDYKLGNNWSLRPSIRYRSLSRDLEFIQNQTTEVDLNYLSFGLGISKSF
ncbi:outer membrane beta-barrel protein [uncultured Winogradskyella sp.]|uniref:outer membrane beta-barrel protein n=1 Tax=uncultured Winogradskyella sp. TaxID=395353 RepID=UPI00260821DC|nr:outer membrane beta-barrel protein [uncultured Winogradskyella sp.]